MTWEDILRKDQETATRTAEIWVANEETIYNWAMGIINGYAYLDFTKEQILVSLAQELPDYMANNDGFMEDLNSPVNQDDTAGDGLVDVDWDEVALLFEEEIEEMVK